MFRREYYTLFTSLPSLPMLFEAERLPLSPERLERRLLMLAPEDALLLQEILDLSLWDQQIHQKKEQDLFYKFDTILPKLSPFLRDVVQWLMDLRTLMAALRKRRKSPEPPHKSELWHLGTWTEHLVRNWSKPTFSLEHRLPWLPELKDAFDKGLSREVEVSLLRLKWSYLSKHAEQHTFYFEAIVCYVLRWHLLLRWLTYNGTAALLRFDALIEEVLAGSSLAFSQEPGVEKSDAQRSEG